MIEFKPRAPLPDDPLATPDDGRVQVSLANDTQIDGGHYKFRAIQPWDYIIANNIPYLEGNIIKYVTRWRDKGGKKDLEKARHYLDKLLETVK